MSTHQVRRDVAGLVTSMALAVIGFFVIGGVRLGDLTSLWSKSDGIFEYQAAKSVQNQGLTNFNDALGYPIGQDWTHFPVLDLMNRVQLQVFGLVFEPVVALNLLMLLSFPLVAGVTYLVLRNLNVSRIVAVVASVSLTLIGYHFDFEHPLLSNYWSVPVGVLWLSVLVNAPSYLRHRGPRAMTVVGVLAGIVVGFHNPQYAVFFLILGAVGVLFTLRTTTGGLAARWRIAVLAAPALAFGTTLLAARVMRQVPVVTAATDRPVEDSFLWAGKLLSAFTVPDGSVLSRLPWNTRLLEAMDSTEWMGVATSLNAVAAAASVVVLVLVLRMVFGTTADLARVRPWTGLWLVALLFFVTTGFGGAFAALVSPQVRVWSRLGVVIAALAITASAVLVTRALERSPVRASRRRTAVGAVVVIVAAVLFVDVFTARMPVQADATTLPALQQLVDAGEPVVGADCPVLNLPVVAFPEGYPKGTMEAYDHLLPYLTDTTWTFSYGAIHGGLGTRWTDHLAVDPPTLGVQAKTLGFCAILVDTHGLDESSPSLAQYASALGEPVASANDRWYLFSLDGMWPDPAYLGIFDKIEVDYGTAFTEPTADDQAIVSRWTTGAPGRLRVWNPADTEITTTMTLTVAAADCDNGQRVEVTVSDADPQTLELGAGQEQTMDVPLVLPARGYRDVTVASSSPTCTPAGMDTAVGVRIEDARFASTA